MEKRDMERVRKARAAGKSFREIEATMPGMLAKYGLKPSNGTAAMRLARKAGAK